MFTTSAILNHPSVIFYISYLLLRGNFLIYVPCQFILSYLQPCCGPTVEYIVLSYKNCPPRFWARNAMVLWDTSPRGVWMRMYSQREGTRQNKSDCMIPCLCITICTCGILIGAQTVTLGLRRLTNEWMDGGGRSVHF